MKYFKILTCFFVFFCQFQGGPPRFTLMARDTSGQRPQKGQEQEGKFEDIINLSKAYQKSEKFEEAEKLLKEKLKESLGKEPPKKLQMEWADMHFAWGVNLYEKRRYAESIGHFEEALNVDQVNRLKRAAVDLNYIGFLYLALGKKKEALAYFENAILITRSVGDWSEEGTALINIGTVYSDRGEYLKAMEYYNKALPLKCLSNKLVDEAAVYINIGAVYYRQGEYRDALEFYQKALSIIRSVGDPAKEKAALRNMAAAYTALGQQQKARDFAEQELNVGQSVGDRASDARSLNRTGLELKKSGQYQQAIQYFNQALAICREMGIHRLQGVLLNNIGMTYATLQKYNRAIEYYLKALVINREEGSLDGEGNTLNNLGSAHSALYQFEQAAYYLEKELEIRKKMNNQSATADTLIDLGYTYYAMNQYNLAVQCFEQMLVIEKQRGNRALESHTLNLIASAYLALSKYDRAMEYYKRALIICRERGDCRLEAGILSNIGIIYGDLEQYEQAAAYYEQALRIHRKIKETAWEANTLNNLGTVYKELGLFKPALEHFQQALAIRKERKDPKGEGEILNSLGTVYFALSQYEQAVLHYEKALVIHREIKNRSVEAQILTNIGVVYSELAQYHLAVEYFEQALAIDKLVKNRPGAATTLYNLGIVYCELGQYAKAREYFERAHSSTEQAKDPSMAGRTVNGLGFVYQGLGQYEQAIEYYKQALQLQQKKKDRYGEGGTLSNLGAVYFTVGNNKRAIEYFEKALAIHNETKKNFWNANTLSNLMFAWGTKNKTPLAIFFGKQSVNVFQQLRNSIKRFKRDVQMDYLEKNKPIYRYLASLLIREGRLSEARQVLEMLKEQEFYQFIRRDTFCPDIFSIQVDFSEFERQWINKYNSVIERLSKISNEYQALGLKKYKNETEKTRLEELRLELPKAQKAYTEFLIELKSEFERYEEDKKMMKKDINGLERQASALQETLASLDKNGDGKHAALHYMVYNDRISVIFTTPYSPPLLRQWSIDEKEMNQMVMEYITLMSKPGGIIKGTQPVKTLEGDKENRNQEALNQILLYQKSLYDIIFKPVAEDIKRYGAINLVISLDGVIRYVPMTALWDGENYLVQEYRMALITPSSLRNIMDIPVKDKKILGLGASRGGQGFAPLPYVGREIRSIVRDQEKGYYGLIKGKAFIDKNFTKDTLVCQLKSKTYPLVHISSHFKFSPGDETNNHLLLGDGSTITLSEIRRQGKLFDKVKLLVLSACQTGVGGNGEEIDGFGELAQQSGAKSVIASLWPVVDESTKELMVNFYRILKEGKVTSKIEALRQAQLELAGLDDMLQKGVGKDRQSSRKRKKYTSSYFWGPFILIGNWR